ncbi:VanZ family protein [Cellulomonas cellasea]|uniref:VanZ-like domain-containing protein n=2 Tax=Cellulomonas cellasea TaxID=43670 RepID=A0A0A0B5I4_9CELL|nr:VanZ family protein [Cellulomonas cellasea]KGM02110.1 hypothetical protein Q760_15345 [Cellulomonas cellasea DSM 20118]GEA89829.1 hypothetical protein CCE01nite_37780 [Cellulomonas cellasea]
MITGTRPRRRTQAVLVVYLLLVAWITLTPDLADNEALGKVRVITEWLDARGLPVTYAGVEAGANVVMFGPFGVLVGLLVRRTRAWWARVVAGGLLLSAGIETAQLLFLPTRVPTVQDVVMNTLGAALGVVVLVVGHRLWLARRDRGAPRDDARAPLAAGAGEARVESAGER